MDKKERFYSTIENRIADRPAWWLGFPTDKALPGLYAHFNVTALAGLKAALDDDMWECEMPYHDGRNNAIYAAFDFSHNDRLISNEERTLSSPGFFMDFEEPSAADIFDWPDPAKYIKKEDCQAAVSNVPRGYPVTGVIWSAHFQDACAAFGMEDALIKMKTAPELFDAVIDKITGFYLKANEIFYEYTKGKLDAVLIGNDFGTQTGLILSPDDLRRFVFKGTRALIKQAHAYGLKVIHHSCGAIDAVIPDLIECGADCIHPIQALARDMDAKSLRDKYYGKVSFCGGLDTQYLLVNGSTSEVKKEIRRLRELFPTGLIISPSHEAILPDVPPENIHAFSEACKGGR